MSKRYVVVILPEKSWELLEETLAMDAESHSFDKDLRRDIKKAMSKILKFSFDKNPKRWVDKFFARKKAE